MGFWSFGIVGVLAYGAYRACRYFNELSESEIEERRAIRRRFDEYKSKMEKRKDEYIKKAKENLGEHSLNASYELNEVMRQAVELCKEDTKKYYEELKISLSERIVLKEELLKEIDNKIKEIEGLTKLMQQTYIRSKSFSIITTQLYEAKNYVGAYIKYLKSYDRELEKNYNWAIKNIEEHKFKELQMEPFDFLLPEFYPYSGKIIAVNSDEISETGEFSKKIQGIYHPNKFKINDLDRIENLKGKDQDISFIIESFDKEEKYWDINYGKGLFVKNLMEQPGLGIEAEVVKLEKDSLLLDYYGVTLKLSRENYLNPRINPMRGSKLTVYPLEIRKNLRGNYMPRVTENPFESIILEYISDIPFLLPEEKKDEFEKKLKEEQLANFASYNWKIGPVEKDSNKLKLQLGEDLGFLVTLKQWKNSDSSYLEFERFLSEEEKFLPQDIYMCLNASLSTYLLEEKDSITEVEKDSMETLINLMIMEFKNQQELIESSPGILYFNKWTEVTNKLLNYLSKDNYNQITCEISNLNRDFIAKGTKLETWSGTIENLEEVIKNLENIYKDSDRRVDFFTENSLLKYEVRFLIDDGKVEIYQKSNDTFLNDLSELENIRVNVYPKKTPYPEIQQKLALDRFRRGDVENTNIKLALLSGENIKESSFSNEKITKYFNRDIENNLYQREIVEKALNSKDIFLIQGPPGTGKTTVIKEIILQQLEINPASNILITSQTNVAVDNVLKGLINDYSSKINEKNMIRCGNEDRVDDDLNDILFDNVLRNYTDSVVLEIPRNGVEADLKETWLTYMANQNSLKNELGEIILKGKQIVGATCVGIAKKRVGLDDLKFDLVIVDEASKALPAEMLIPLNKAKKCIIIGDQKQLPPTINPFLLNKDESQLEDYAYCKEEMFNKSLFEKIFSEAPDYAKSMLRTQYRMPLTIGNMISQFFYENNLENGDICKLKKPIYNTKNLNWLDTSKIKDCFEDDKNGSPKNKKEAEIITNLIKDIRSRGIDNRIAVITPYKGQKRVIKKLIRESSLLENVAVDTIDSFQGDEADLVIFSTTRSKKPTEFFKDNARLNVAFSRVKRELIIVGSLEYFYKKYGPNSKLFEIAKYIGEVGNTLECNY